ncbi:unnamed protein product [Effrenium voratum]|nr:unnamed protein product [Effrenium voratum]
MEAVEELRNRIRESASRAEKQIDARAAEVAESLRQLEAERQKVDTAKRRLEEERMSMRQVQEAFSQQQEEVEQLRAEVAKLRRSGGLFGCCMNPSITNGEAQIEATDEALRTSLPDE